MFFGFAAVKIRSRITVGQWVMSVRRRSSRNGILEGIVFETGIFLLLLRRRETDGRNKKYPTSKLHLHQTRLWKLFWKRFFALKLAFFLFISSVYFLKLFNPTRPVLFIIQLLCGRLHHHIRDRDLFKYHENIVKHKFPLKISFQVHFDPPFRPCISTLHHNPVQTSKQT